MHLSYSSFLAQPILWMELLHVVPHFTHWYRADLKVGALPNKYARRSEVAG